MPNIVMLANLDVLQIFCSQGSINLQCISQKGHTSTTSPNEKKYGFAYFSCLFYIQHL